MTDLEELAATMEAFAGLKAADFQLSASFWQNKHYKKGEFYNEHRNICKHLGFITNGVFRSYTIDEKTGEEKNVFLYSTNGFVVTFKSFINQIPCDYFTQAMTDASVIYINILDLQSLYQRFASMGKIWQAPGARSFNVTMTRIEGFMFKTPEERYLDLVKQHPDIFNHVPLYHISSYLGIQGPSLSRIRKRISEKN
nr:Crp/Fnr family transcriptional regulator [Haliscomenobacter sp.]